jgi:inner membrane protein
MFRRKGQRKKVVVSLGNILGRVTASLVWTLILFVAGILATRYIERIEHTVVGYLVLGVAAFVLSLIRAWLYRQRTAERTVRPLPSLAEFLHTITYLLLTLNLYLAVSWLVKRSADPVLLFPLAIGALLPGLDSTTSMPGWLLPAISQNLQARFGHRGAWHTLAAAGFVGLITAPTIFLFDIAVWYLLLLGFCTHLLLDMLSPQGLMLFWPVQHKRYYILGAPVKSIGDSTERKILVGLCVVAVALLLTIDLGPPPAPPVSVPSYEQTLDRYYRLRGQNLIFAYVQGTWQVTGRRMSGRFEILNARGTSFVMLDRYTGQVFTAGRSADDNLYLNYISLQTGAAIRVKPAEIHLEEQPLADALPVLYEMEKEPGLQYIYAFGDLTAFGDLVSNSDSEELEIDYTPNSLKRIHKQEPGHYSLDYLPAPNLIAWEALPVLRADLVIVATYITPASGPTVTPLPPPATSEVAP